MSNYKSKIKTTDTSIKMRKIEKFVIVFSESIKINIDISEFLHEKSITAKISKTFHIMNDLSVKILIKMNIIESKRMIIDFKKLAIENCQNVLIELIAINSTDSKIRKIIMSIKKIIVFLHINQFIFATIKEKFKIFLIKTMFFIRHTTTNLISKMTFCFT